MSTSPQLLYMILILPSLFGLTLIGEGLNKIVHSDWTGLISLIFGIIFLPMFNIFSSDFDSCILFP